MATVVSVSAFHNEDAKLTVPCQKEWGGDMSYFPSGKKKKQKGSSTKFWANIELVTLVDDYQYVDVHLALLLVLIRLNDIPEGDSPEVDRRGVNSSVAFNFQVKFSSNRGIRSQLQELRSLIFNQILLVKAQASADVSEGRKPAHAAA